MNSFDDLRNRLNIARGEYQDALAASSEAIQFRTGIPDPDGTQLLYHANERLRTAFARYLEAIKGFNDHVLNRERADQSCDDKSTLPLIPEVLFIEDNHPEARLLEEIVARGPSPVKITTATDCSGALAHLSGKLHLVIADMGVLEFGGPEFLKHCNSLGIPVVIFSGSKNPKNHEKVLLLGAKEFVEKPNNLDEYTDAVRKIISTWAKPSASSSKAGAI